jgi:poly-gamma-glutamate synthesis protein (capsule biosynthesis protein)
MEALSISGALRFAVKTVHTFAGMFGAWKRPSVKAAADFEEMTLMHKFYWGYKSKKPVMKPEKGLETGTLFKRSAGAFSPPGEFEVTNTVTMGAVGDLIKTAGLENSRDNLYENVADLVFDRDISYANLESQLTAGDLASYTFSEKETPPLCCSDADYDALKGHKGKVFTVMHTACNHTLDMGLEGLETTLDRLEKDNIIDLGTNREPDQQSMGRVVEKNGVKVGFVSATYGLNGKEVPPGKEYMVNVMKFHRRLPGGEEVDLSLLHRQIDFCRGQGCDIIVASLHWGYEYEFFPRRRQVDIAHAVVEAGVDVIISHHAHVIQPVEFYRPRRDPRRTAVIAYSLGNLTSSFSAPYLVLSGVLDLTIVKGKAAGQEMTFVRDARMIPVVQWETREGDAPAIRLERLDALSAAREGNISKEEKDYISAIEGFAEFVLGGGE